MKTAKESLEIAVVEALEKWSLLLVEPAPGVTSRSVQGGQLHRGMGQF